MSSGQGGGAHVIPHLVGTPGDPCQHKPDDHEVMLIHAPGRSLHGHVKLDCGEWRETVRRAVERGAGGRATIRQILACIRATVHRGDWARNADSYARGLLALFLLTDTPTLSSGGPRRCAVRSRTPPAQPETCSCATRSSCIP